MIYLQVSRLVMRGKARHENSARGRVATVHHEHGAVDERTGFRGKVERCTGHILGATPSSQRSLFHGAPAIALVLDSERHLRRKMARSNGIDRDVSFR